MIINEFRMALDSRSINESFSSSLDYTGNQGTLSSGAIDIPDMTLASGESKTIDLTFTVDTNARLSELSNQAEITEFK